MPRLPALLVVAITACRPPLPVPTSSPSPTAVPTPSMSPEEAGRQMTRIMERNDLQLSALQSDVSKKRGPEACHPRLGSMAMAIREAASLRVMATDAEQAELGQEFTRFLKLLSDLGNDPWSEETAVKAYQAVEQGCNHCHLKFK